MITMIMSIAAISAVQWICTGAWWLCQLGSDLAHLHNEPFICTMVCTHSCVQIYVHMRVPLHRYMAPPLLWATCLHKGAITALVLHMRVHTFVRMRMPLHRYMVALKDRLVQADNTQLAPVVQPGAQVHYLPQGRAQTVPAEVVLANDGMGW